MKGSIQATLSLLLLTHAATNIRASALGKEMRFFSFFLLVVLAIIIF